MDHQHEPDGINEALAGALRVSLTVAGHVGERIARSREQAARDARGPSPMTASDPRRAPGRVSS